MRPAVTDAMPRSLVIHRGALFAQSAMNLVQTLLRQWLAMPGAARTNFLPGNQSENSHSLTWVSAP